MCILFRGTPWDLNLETRNRLLQFGSGACWDNFLIRWPPDPPNSKLQGFIDQPTAVPSPLEKEQRMCQQKHCLEGVESR